jgi:hypothetical protein
MRACPAGWLRPERSAVCIIVDTYDNPPDGSWMGRPTATRQAASQRACGKKGARPLFLPSRFAVRFRVEEASILPPLSAGGRLLHRRSSRVRSSSHNRTLSTSIIPYPGQKSSKILRNRRKICGIPRGPLPWRRTGRVRRRASGPRPGTCPGRPEGKGPPRAGTQSPPPPPGTGTPAASTLNSSVRFSLPSR